MRVTEAGHSLRLPSTEARGKGGCATQANEPAAAPYNNIVKPQKTTQDNLGVTLPVYIWKTQQAMPLSAATLYAASEGGRGETVQANGYKFRMVMASVGEGKGGGK